MHLAIGSFISNDDPGMAKWQCSGLVQQNKNFSSASQFFFCQLRQKKKQTNKEKECWQRHQNSCGQLQRTFLCHCCTLGNVLASFTQFYSLKVYLFTGWFGIRKDFCDFLLGTCPFLQEYGNISCKFSESIFLRPPPEETAVEPQRKPVMHEYPAKCVVPVVSIEMPDQWKKIPSLYIVKEYMYPWFGYTTLATKN